jgi:hypothetical protein
MGIILMRVSARRGSWTSGVFQRLMAETFPDIDAVASDGWSGPAAAQLCAFGPLRGRGVGPRARFVPSRDALCRGARHGHPEISDDVASRIDLARLYDPHAR